MEQCSTCDFWREKPVDKNAPVPRDSLTVGVCHLHPPRLMLIPFAPTPMFPEGGANLQGLRPNTFNNDGCSNHRPAASLKN